MKIRAIESRVFEYETICGECGGVLAIVTIILNEEGATAIIRLPEYDVCINTIDIPRYHEPGSTAEHEYYSDEELISILMDYLDEDYIRATVENILAYERAGGLYED